MLRTHDRASDLDMVLDDVLSRSWQSLGRFDAAVARWELAGDGERPRLGAWVCKIAKDTVREWSRSNKTKRPLGPTSGQRRALAIDVIGLDVADLPVETLNATVVGVELNDAEADPAMAALRVLHRLITARPGGGRAWDRIVASSLDHPERGAPLREEIRVFITAQSAGQVAPVGPRLMQLARRYERESTRTPRRGRRMGHQATGLEAPLPTPRRSRDA